MGVNKLDIASKRRNSTNMKKNDRSRPTSPHSTHSHSDGSSSHSSTPSSDDHKSSPSPSHTPTTGRRHRHRHMHGNDANMRDPAPMNKKNHVIDDANIGNFSVSNDDDDD